MSTAAQVTDNYSLDSENIPLMTEQEQEQLNKLNSITNKLSKDKKRDFMDKSLNTIITEWSRIMSDIFYDLTTKVHISKYINDSNNLYDFVVKFATAIWSILSSDDRLMYVGFTLLFIVVVLLFLDD
jgi:hypothetical protein